MKWPNFENKKWQYVGGFARYNQRFDWREYIFGFILPLKEPGKGERGIRGMHYRGFIISISIGWDTASMLTIILRRKFRTHVVPIIPKLYLEIL